MRFKPKQGQRTAEVMRRIEGPIELETEDSVVKVSGKFHDNPFGIPIGKGTAIVGGGGKVTPAA